MRLYTDASSRGSISGIAFVATNSRDKEVFKNGMVIEKGDNNTAELTAILYALDFVRDKTDHKVVIFTDSSYAINAIRNGNFRETERTLVESIQQSMSELGSTLFWVKGHCHDGTVLAHFNKRADKMSKVVRKQYQKEKRVEKKLNIKQIGRYTYTSDGPEI